MNTGILKGYMYGTFIDQQGQERPYAKIYIEMDFSGEVSAKYHFGGTKCVERACLNEQVILSALSSGIKIGDRIFYALADTKSSRVCFITAA